MADPEIDELRIRPREGGYARGQEGVEQILRAALALLVEHGSKALTLRRIAAECGVNVGNVSYYFRSKEELIRALLDAVIGMYEESFDVIVHDPSATAEERLARLLTLILEDITTKKTTRLFPELWAMANHDRFVEERLEELYARARVSLNEVIAEINPALPDDEREALALFMSASMEGMTIFAGHDKPWEHRMPWLIELSCRSFLQLARTLAPGDIKEIVRD